MKLRYGLFLLGALFIAGCAPSQAEIAAKAAAQATTEAASWTATPTIAATLTPSVTPTETPIPTETITPTPAPTQQGGGMGTLLFVHRKIISLDEKKFLDNIYKIDMGNLSAEPVNLTKTDDPATRFFYPAWSRDGKMIAFERSTVLSKFKIKTEIYTMDADGSNQKKISTDPVIEGTPVVDVAIDQSPSWSPDGTKLAISSNRDSLSVNPDKYAIYILDIATSTYTKVTDMKGAALAPDWSPDGKTITFMTNEKGNWDVYTINVDGSNLTQVTKTSNNERYPRWSPDGTQIIFHQVKGPNYDLWTVSPDGSNLTQITKDPESEATARYSPDGKWVVYQYNNNTKDGTEGIYILNLETKEAIKVYDTEDEEYLGTFQP